MNRGEHLSLRFSHFKDVTRAKTRCSQSNVHDVMETDSPQQQVVGWKRVRWEIVLTDMFDLQCEWCPQEIQ